MNAYDEGYRAFEDGMSIEDNPYDQFIHNEYDLWESGYIDADAYESGEFEPTTR